MIYLKAAALCAWAYFWNVLISIDQLANTLIGGDPDETLSSMFGKNVARCAICALICKWLDRVDKRHCHKSIEEDEGKQSIMAIWKRETRKG